MGISPLQGVRASYRPLAAATALLVALLAAPASADEQTLGAAAASAGRYYGAAIDADALNEKSYSELAAKELTSLTPENAMKWGELEPTRGAIAWRRADDIVQFAEAHALKVRGHNLVWHQQLPRWLVAGNFPPKEIRSLMLAHIDAEVGRYKGRIYAWDVVNEPLTESGEWRPSPFYEAMGPEYVALALRQAHAADPRAKLYINDYGVETAGAKSTALYNLVAALKREGVPIDGVGFQAHFVAGSAPTDFQDVLARFAALGVDVAVTELDVRVRLPATKLELATQAEDYGAVVATCRNTPRCVGVTAWGLSDAHSWIPSFFSGYGDALPFDDEYHAKPAAAAISAAFEGRKF